MKGGGGGEGAGSLQFCNTSVTDQKNFTHTVGDHQKFTKLKKIPKAESQQIKLTCHRN